MCNTGMQSFLRRKWTWLRCLGVFTLIWVLLTQGHTDSWVIGVMAVPCATWCYMQLLPRSRDKSRFTHHRFRLYTTLYFMWFFILQSLKGGWDSARFAFHPYRRVNPTFIQYRTRLPVGHTRLFFINVISLLPGTLSTTFNDDVITIHVLDADADNEGYLQQCETVIAELFGLMLEGVPNQKIIKRTR